MDPGFIARAGEMQSLESESPGPKASLLHLLAGKNHHLASLSLNVPIFKMVTTANAHWIPPIWQAKCYALYVY